MVSVIQNFICTDEKRLEVMLNNLPALGEAFEDYEFYVNFNDTVNLDIVQKSYKKYIKKLNFYNNLERQWAEVTLAMLEEVDTEYIINLCEDQVVHFNSTDLKNVLNESTAESYAVSGYEIGLPVTRSVLKLCQSQ